MLSGWDRMRYEGVARAGFYPTPTTQTDKIMQRIKLTGPTRLFDPCAGEGEALAQAAQYAPAGSVTYGIELDKARAQKARAVLDHAVACGYESARVEQEAFPLLWLNPPYDNVAGMGGDSSRTELRFLRHTSKFVTPNGVLVFIIPRYTLTKDMVGALEHRYTNLKAYRFDDSEYEVYKQVVVFGTRRERNLESAKNLTEEEHTARNELLMYGKDLNIPMPFLDEEDDRVWTVPAFEDVATEIEFRGHIRDEQELIQDLQGSDAFITAENLLNSALVETKLKRPLLPHRKTHLATLIASGVLNGSLGIGEDRHMVIGVSRKQVKREETVDEDGNVTVMDIESYVTLVRTIQPDGTIIDLQ